jgi:hypothetical protein
VHVRADAEFGIGVGESGQLGYPQAGLHRGEQQRVVTTAEDGGGVRGVEYRVDLGAGDDARSSRTRGHFPNDDAVIKLLWLAIRDIEDKRARARAKEKGAPP